MSLENGRDLVRGLLVLLFVIVAWRLDLTAGLALLAVLGLLLLQSAFTNWCPADLFLQPLGLKSSQHQN